MKRLAVLLTLVALALTLATPVVATDNEKWFVCKYTGTPGVDEALQGGGNPISTDASAIPDPEQDGVHAGDQFSDAQGRSIVLVEDTGQVPEPDENDCPPPDTGEPDVPDLTFTDCEAIGALGSITVDGLDSETFLQVNGPTVLTITEDGEYPLLPGLYGFRVVFDGEPLDQGTFTIGECPEPPVIGAFSVEVCPVTGAAPLAVGQSQIRFRGALLLIMLLNVRVDGQLVTLQDTLADGTVGDLLVTPGVHAWSISNAADTEVLASGVVDCPECNPATASVPGSIPDTATALVAGGGVFWTWLFALILFTALAVLAGLNVRARHLRG